MTSTTIQCSECDEGFIREPDGYGCVQWTSCYRCGGTSVIIQQGDGSFAKRLANGCCVQCHTFLDGADECKVCKLKYGVSYGNQET